MSPCNSKVDPYTFCFPHQNIIPSSLQIKVMPDDWLSTMSEVCYLYLSENPWTCTCSAGYFRSYLEEYEYNVYTRDGVNIQIDVDSVVSLLYISIHMLVLSDDEIVYSFGLLVLSLINLIN